MDGQRHAPAVLPPGKMRYPLYRRLGGPQDRSGRVRKISPPPGFDPRAVQPLASRYTDCAVIEVETVSFCKNILYKKLMEYRNQGRHDVEEGHKNPSRQVAVATKFRNMSLNISGSSVWNLGRCATTLKVAGSIPDGVIGIFY